MKFKILSKMIKLSTSFHFLISYLIIIKYCNNAIRIQACDSSIVISLLNKRDEQVLFYGFKAFLDMVR
jgi:hypothetical protein